MIFHQAVDKLITVFTNTYMYRRVMQDPYSARGTVQIAVKQDYPANLEDTL